MTVIFFVVTMVTILYLHIFLYMVSIISENKESSFMLKCCYSRKKYLSKLKQYGLPEALNKKFSFKCLAVMIYEHFIVYIVQLVML